MILASKMQCLKVFLSINDDDNQEREAKIRHEDSSSLCEGNGELCLLGSCVCRF